MLFLSGHELGTPAVESRIQLNIEHAHELFGGQCNEKPYQKSKKNLVGVLSMVQRGPVNAT